MVGHQIQLLVSLACFLYVNVHHLVSSKSEELKIKSLHHLPLILPTRLCVV